MSDEMFDMDYEITYMTRAHYTLDDTPAEAQRRKELFFRTREYGESQADYDRAFNDYERARSWGMEDD